jgi:hypothetical protein
MNFSHSAERMSSVGLAWSAVARPQAVEERGHHGVAAGGVGDDDVEAARAADHARPVDHGGDVDDAATDRRRADMCLDEVDAVDAVLQRQDAGLRAEQGAERARRGLRCRRA